MARIEHYDPSVKNKTDFYHGLLRCWEEYLRLEPDASVRSNADGLRSSMRPDERVLYELLNDAINTQLGRFSERKRRIYMFNLPFFLGVASVDTSALSALVGE